MSKNRISWIDIAKGIGIILVLYGHGLTADSYRHIIYAFHMPLFFFLSGIIFHHKNHEHFFPMLFKNVKSILIPYIFFAIISYSIWFIASNQMQISLTGIYQLFSGIVYGNATNNTFFYNVVLWYLPCLFITKTAFWLLTAVFQKRFFLFGSLFLLSLIGYFYPAYFPESKLPMGLEAAFTAIVFFGIGYLWNTQKESGKLWFARHAFLLFTILLSICIITAEVCFELYGSQVDIRLSKYHNYALFYLGAFSGIFAVVAASILIKTNWLLEYIGRHSLHLFVWHLIVFTYFTKLIRQFITSETIELLRNTYLAPLYTITTIFLILSFVYIKKRFMLRIHFG